ncbi:eukaryotic translation initiation factor 3 subunit A-like isoform X3 [Teleopsis dalmanni]|uniref:eukaryotic translation initiation factor 3 subunit A-like isoform X3 n=1 Tax=Teleopsis dalmanni TaxID=139649 RepID=UPI0018CE7A95|nr:eukaryotic translation initiation factor 3 subunit A-like isoform X3 [Teleopsis dalmanni]
MIQFRNVRLFIMDAFEAIKDVVEEQDKASYEVNKDAIKERSVSRYEANKNVFIARAKARYQANKEAIKEQSKKRYAANKAIIKEKSKARCESNKEQTGVDVNKDDIKERFGANYIVNEDTIKEQKEVNTDIITEQLTARFESNQQTQNQVYQENVEKLLGQDEYDVKKGPREKCGLQTNKDVFKERSIRRYRANKDTMKERSKTRYKENKDAIKERSRARYWANKEAIREQKRVYYEARKDFIKKQSKAKTEAEEDIIKEQSMNKYEEMENIDNNARFEEQSKARYQAKKDSLREQSRARYAANKDAIKQRAREKYAANKESIKAKCRAIKKAMIEEFERNGNCKYKKRPNKMWKPTEERALMNFLKENTEFEKPTAKVFYDRFLHDSGVNADWKMVRSKMFNMRKTYKKTKEWLKNEGTAITDSEELKNAIRNKFRFYYDFEIIFGSNSINLCQIANTDSETKTNQAATSEASVTIVKNENEASEICYDKMLSASNDRSISVSETLLSETENQPTEDVLEYSSSNCCSGVCLRLTALNMVQNREDILTLSMEKMSYDLVFRKKKLHLLYRQAALQEEELKLKERVLKSQEHLKILELQKREEIAMAELELKYKNLN